MVQPQLPLSPPGWVHIPEPVPSDEKAPLHEAPLDVPPEVIFKEALPLELTVPSTLNVAVVPVCCPVPVTMPLVIETVTVPVAVPL